MIWTERYFFILEWWKNQKKNCTMLISFIYEVSVPKPSPGKIDQL